MVMVGSFDDYTGLRFENVIVNQVSPYYLFFALNRPGFWTSIFQMRAIVFLLFIYVAILEYCWLVLDFKIIVEALYFLYNNSDCKIQSL